MLRVRLPVHVKRELNEGTKTLFTLAKGNFHSLALNELTNLAAESSHHFE